MSIEVCSQKFLPTLYDQGWKQLDVCRISRDGQAYFLVKSVACIQPHLQIASWTVQMTPWDEVRSQIIYTRSTPRPDTISPK